MALCQIAGESALAARVPVALARAREVVARLIVRLAGELGGTVVEANVEGTLVSFAEVRSAAGFALRLQVELLAQEWPSTLLLRPEGAERHDGEVLIFRGLAVRAALHAGPLCAGEGAAALAPIADHAARLASVAAPGQILLTDGTWRLLVGNPGSPFVLRDLGAHRLPGVLGRHRLLQVQAASLDRRPVITPTSLDTARTNRPEPIVPLLGRAGELTAIAELYRMGVRLVTLVGAHGAGHRSVARQVAAAAQQDDLPGGVWWCAVGARSTPASPGEDPPTGDLVRSLADALGIGISHARSDADAAAQLGWSLSARERFLLVLEGVDLADPESVAFVSRWVRSAPLGRFLCLAPWRLGIPGEVVFRLGALAVRPAPSDAARWLLQRVPPHSGLPPIDPMRVEALAAVLGGVPQHLAIAGGLLGQLSPDELAARLGDSTAPLFPLTW
ncbi:MAG: hypothetical protein H0V89_06570, partial [Deltaproteobacteria bacterium]|nr:hypothetical protein [Deltaproteobacteria bacterium]